MIQKIEDILYLVFNEGDKRVNGLLFSSPQVPFYTLFIYVLLVKVIGPRFMKNRPPYELKSILLVYNAFQVALSAYIFIIFSYQGWWSLTNWFKCKPIYEHGNPEFQHWLNAHHLYYISKYTELFDTVFFVLRKKYNQVSFLHVYHHGSMPFFTCLTIRFAPGSSICAVAFLNSFVHVVMYGYYMLAALGPEIQKYLWWKKYITSLQLIQFMTLFVHFLVVLSSNCNIPKGLTIFMLSNIFFNFALFYVFYRREYIQKMKAKKSSIQNERQDITKLNVKHEIATNELKEDKRNSKLNTVTKDIKYRGHS